MEGYFGEVRLFAGNFAPKNWAFCDGSLIQVASNTALFAEIKRGKFPVAIKFPRQHTRKILFHWEFVDDVERALVDVTAGNEAEQPAIRTVVE